MQLVKQILSEAMEEPYRQNSGQRVCADALYNALIASPRVRNLPLMERALESFFTKPLKQAAALARAALAACQGEE